MEQLYPFVKNRYFPYKRTRSADFIRDQAFADRKLSFLNHWTLGEGAALGLGVQRVDSETLLVEPGFAVDGRGRYIVVDEAAIRRVRALDGYDALQGENAVLWLEYEEEELEPMLVMEDGREVERKAAARERFRLSLRGVDSLPPPAAERGLFSEFVLFANEELRVTQSIPALFSGTRPTLLRLIIENFTAEAAGLDLTYQPKLPGFAGKDGGEPALRRQLSVEMGETVLTLPVYPVSPGQTAAVRVEPQDFELARQGQRYGAGSAFYASFPVAAGDAGAELEEALYRQDLRESWEPEEGGVPIAYLRLIRAENKCMLDAAAPMGNRRRAALPYWRERARRAAACYGHSHEGARPAPAPGPAPEPPAPAPEPRRMATGVVVLSTGLHMAKGSILYSGETVHGLGPGNVFVEFGVENVYPVANDDRNRTDLLLGDVSLFAQASGSYDADFDRGVRIHPEKGTFELAVRLKSAPRQASLRLRWYAWLAEEARRPREPAGTLLRLDPDVIRVKPGENVQFSPVFSGGRQAPCAFYVEERRSGSVTRDGVYTAPDHAGLFMVRAKAESGGQASAFVIVGEDGHEDG